MRSNRNRKIKQHEHCTQRSQYRNDTDILDCQIIFQNKKTSLILTVQSPLESHKFCLSSRGIPPIEEFHFALMFL